mgnify:CR=1 FL=1
MRFSRGINGNKAQHCPPPDASLPEYTVIYSDRKTLSMELKGGALLLRAPKKCPQSTIIRFILSHKDWILSRASAPRRLIERELTPEELQHLKERARAYILPRARSLALSLNLGTDARFGITSARTRFGSCSQSNSINFSCFLALYPDECIDYVILHELCHTVHKNHSRAFYSLLEQYLPDRRERERLLRTL